VKKHKEVSMIDDDDDDDVSIGRVLEDVESAASLHTPLNARSHAQVQRVSKLNCPSAQVLTKRSPLLPSPESPVMLSWLVLALIGWFPGILGRI